ncbi:MAG: hypothetical protein HY904_10270 [Deltaproteobacteria bacterium]|nr:hypothetical protein [Deltaproteobacteria bacterium]
MSSLAVLINAYSLPTGRRLVAHREVRIIADRTAQGPLVAHLDRALIHDTQVRRMEVEFRNNRNRPTDSGPLLALDMAGDRILSALYDGAGAVVRANVPGTPVAAARTLLEQIFPAGVAAISQKPLEEQWTETDIIVERFAGDLGPVMDALHFQPYAVELARIAREVRALMRSTHNGMLTLKKLTDARQVGHQGMLETMARVIGLFPEETDEQTQRRAELLGPVLTQQEEVRAARKRRRPPTDVNPDTGEVEMTDDIPG